MKLVTHFLVALMLIAAQAHAEIEWNQFGQDILNSSSVNQTSCGRRLSISGDGTLVAIDCEEAIRLYQFSNDAWSVRGIIHGESSTYSADFAFSRNGLTLVKAVKRYLPSIGYVRIFNVGNGEINEQSSPIVDGKLGELNSGSDSVAVNADGTIVAIGSVDYQYPRVKQGTGFVRIYRVSNEGSHEQLGESISFGEGGNGLKLSLSDDGFTLALAIPYSETCVTNRGRVIVYKFDGHTWNQNGDALCGPFDGAQIGESIQLSGNGMRIAIGQTGDEARNGSVSVYDITNERFKMIGEKVVGWRNDGIGRIVSLSYTGDVLAAGGDSVARMFRLENTGGRAQWLEHGVVSASSIGYEFPVALSSDGKRLVAGSSYTGYTGTVRVYESAERTRTLPNRPNPMEGYRRTVAQVGDQLDYVPEFGDKTLSLEEFCANLCDQRAQCQMFRTEYSSCVMYATRPCQSVNSYVDRPTDARPFPRPIDLERGRSIPVFVQDILNASIQVYEKLAPVTVPTQNRVIVPGITGPYLDTFTRTITNVSSDYEIVDHQRERECETLCSNDLKCEMWVIRFPFSLESLSFVAECKTYGSTPWSNGEVKIYRTNEVGLELVQHLLTTRNSVVSELCPAFSSAEFGTLNGIAEPNDGNRFKIGGVLIGAIVLLMISSILS